MIKGKVRSLYHTIDHIADSIMNGMNRDRRVQKRVLMVACVTLVVVTLRGSTKWLILDAQDLQTCDDAADWRQISLLFVIPPKRGEMVVIGTWMSTSISGCKLMRGVQSSYEMSSRHLASAPSFSAVPRTISGLNQIHHHNFKVRCLERLLDKKSAFLGCFGQDVFKQKAEHSPLLICSQTAVTCES